MAKTLSLKARKNTSAVKDEPLKLPGRLLYVAVRDRIVKDLVVANLKPGDRYFSEGELADRYNVSRNTIRRAMTDMEDRGYLKRQRGRGNFVAQPPSVSLHPYAPDMKASASLRNTDNDRSLAIIFPIWDTTTEGFYSGRILQELTVLASGMHLPIQIRHPDDFRSMGDPNKLAILAIDPRHESQLFISSLATQGAHVMIVSGASTIPTVLNLDNTVEATTYNAVMQFAKLGHEHIGIINHDTRHKDYTRTLEGFLQAHRELNRPIHPLAIVQNFHGRDASIPIDPKQITAWICTYNSAVTKLAARCDQENLRIPEDVSLVSLDSATEKITAAVGKRISVVRPDARLTAQAVIHAIENWRENSPGDVIELPMQTVQGQTIAPAKQ